MRFMSFALLFMLAIAGCNNDRTCNRQEDCQPGQTCAILTHVCVVIPAPDMTAPAGGDMSMGGGNDLSVSVDMSVSPDLSATPDMSVSDMKGGGDMVPKG